MNAPALPYAFARKHGVLVQAVNDGVISLVLRDDAQLSVLAELRRHFGMTTAVCGQLPSAAFAERLAQSYAQADAAAAVVQDFGQDVDLSRLMQELPPVEDLLDSQNEAPIIRLVNALFTQAVHEGVSDIHIEPFEDSSTVRFRRDGLLREVARPPRSLHGALASRIKVMASLDIAEKRLPQDGRIALRLGHKLVDVRVSSAPAAHGERLVLRLLDKDASRLQLAALGMPDDTRARFETLLHQPHGIVLVTGPTGSGKTTTLYAALHTIDAGTTQYHYRRRPYRIRFARCGADSGQPAH
jgi:general secretion pathway protein E